MVTNRKPPTAPRLAPKVPKAPPPKAKKKTAPTKTFRVQPWTGAGEGEKIVCYGVTGLGKTTLLATAPNPIFIGLDDGGRKILNPITGEPLNRIPDIETFEDVRVALQQTNLFPKGSSCVIDTATILESLTGDYVLATVKKKGDVFAKNIKDYGWNDGSSHVLDAFRLILQDLDALIRRGANVCLICQEQAIVIANPGGQDYLQACPKLHHDRQHSLMLAVCEWADHIFRVSYLNTTVRPEGERITGKVERATERAVFVSGAQDYMAKSRTLGQFVTEAGEPVESIKFESPADKTLWEFLFSEDE